MNSSTVEILTKPYQFSTWTFNPADGRLISKYKSDRLPPKLSKLLSILIKNQGEILSREVLVEAIWSSKIVNDDALSRSIAELRKILGDTPASSIYIETIPKKGYRFCCEINKNQTSKVAPSRSKNSYKLVILLFICMGIFIAFIFIKSKAPAEPVIALKTSAQIIIDALVSAKRITTDKALEHQPRLSHKGDMLAFSMNEDERFIVKIIDSTGRLIYKIIEHEYHLYSPTFSIKDNSIIIAGINKKGCKTFLYQLPSLHKTELTTCSLPSLSNIYDWSPDGKTIAFVKKSKNQKTTAIWLWDIENSKAQQFSFPTELSIFDTHPKFSPDGNKIAFTRGTKSKRKILYLSVNESIEPINVTLSRGYISGFDWLKTGEEIIYDSNERGDRNLFLANLNQKSSILLGARGSRFPSLDTNNQRMAYQDIQYNANIWQVNLTVDKAKATPLINAIKYNNFPSFSPDGESVAFVSNREGKSGIWLYNMKTSKQKKLITIIDKNLFEPNWAMDGNRLLVSSRGANGYTCYLVNIRSGIYQQLSDSENKYQSCQYSKMGAIYAMSKRESKSSYMLKIDSQGKHRQLSSQPISRFQLSSIDTIIYTKPNINGIYQMDMQGFELDSLVPDFAHNLSEHWLVKDHFIYYPKLEGRKGLWRLNLIDGEDSLITEELPSAIGQTLSVNQDHTLLILTKTDNSSSEIYMVDIKPSK